MNCIQRFYFSFDFVIGKAFNTFLCHSVSVDPSIRKAGVAKKKSFVVVSCIPAFFFLSFALGYLRYK